MMWKDTGADWPTFVKKYLDEAKNLKNKAHDALERTLYNYLKAKLKIKMDDFSKENSRDLDQQKIGC